MPFRRALREAWRQETAGSSVETQGVDRAVIFVLVIAIGCGVLAEMWTNRAYLAPVLVSGKAIEQRIDVEIGDMLAARNPSVSVGHARCPFFLDLTAQRAGRCSLPVSETELSVRVVSDEARNVTITSEDAAVFMPDAERRIAGALEERYGEPFRVRCPDPQVHVLRRDESLVCWIDAADVARTPLEVRVAGGNGELFPAEVRHVPTRLERVFGRTVTELRTGTVTVAGRLLETYVRGSAAAEANGEAGRRGLVGTAHCPRIVVLRALAHAYCTVRVGSRAQIYEVRFDEGRGLEIAAQQSVIALPAVKEIAARYFERTWPGGKPLRARVDCGNDSVVLVEPGALVPCTVAIGGDQANFAVRVTDAAGTFDFVERD